MSAQAAAPGPPPEFTLQSLMDFLRMPDARESLSPLLGAGALVLDLDESASPLAEAESRALAELLPTLPCVTVARSAEPDTVWGTRCDVQVEDETALEGLLAGIAVAPIAALGFVQRLRVAPSRPRPAASYSLAETHAGLVAESFVYSTLQSGREFRSWREGRKLSWLDRRLGRRSRALRRPGGGEAQEQEEVCRLCREEDRLEVVLNRPLKHNAFSRAMRDGLAEALSLAIVDDSIQQIVLQGAGESFCSGGDLDEFGSFSDPAAAHATRMTRSPALLMAQLADRIECRVQGACLGAGAELPAFAGRVVAEENAYFGLPELALGLIPGAGGTVSLPRRIGRQRTAWLGLSGERIDARTALDWGLVDEVRLAHPVVGASADAGRPSR